MESLNSETVWEVKDPQEMPETEGFFKLGSVVKYTVTGVDDQGHFTVQRRYNEFYQLWECLAERWPGCFVPGIPPKDKLKNKESNYLETRRMLLERFMRECSKHPYLINATEFKIFTRDLSGEVTDKLVQLPKQKPKQILEKYNLIFKGIDVEQYTDDDIENCNDNIGAFQVFLAKAIKTMEADARDIKRLAD